MSGICAEVCCCGMPYTCLNGIIGGCINLFTSALPSSGLSGMLSLCGSTCSALAGMVSGLLGGVLGGGGSTVGGVVTEALPAVMQNAGGGK